VWAQKQASKKTVNKWVIIAGVFLGLAFFAVSRTSAGGVERIKQFEALRLSPYKDIAGKWTIGYGHLIKPSESYLLSGQITPQKADALLRADLKGAENAVNKWVTVPLSKNQRDSLVSLVFNIGEGNFNSSTMLRLINQKKYNEAAAQFPRWIFAGGKQSVGLMARRASEQNVFLT